jgi:hypothetical protein
LAYAVANGWQTVDRAGFSDVFDPDLIGVDGDHVVTRGGRGPRRASIDLTPGHELRLLGLGSAVTAGSPPPFAKA